MGIIILSQSMKTFQIVKLFSNPVSGITCDLGVVSSNETWDAIKNIRYSKSMMLGALKFWIEQYCSYYLKLRRIDTAFIKMSYKIDELIQELITREKLVKSCPDSFLFSHRYIKELSNKDKTCILLDKKYKDEISRINNGFRPQAGTLDPHIPIMSTTGISFTIFANEHPYIHRQKISKVGMTDRGNIYILHKKKVGA